MTSFWRIIKFAFQDIARNLGLSFMTVFILVLMLLSLNALWSLDIITNQAVGLVKGQVNMSLYLAADISDKNFNEIESYVKSFPEVTDLKTLTRDEVLKSFTNRHRLSPEVLDALKELGGNPFGPTIIVKTREPEDYKKIIVGLNTPEYDPLIEAKSFDQQEDILTKLQNITNRVERVGFGLTLLFGLISFLIIFNTVRVAINTQRVEISIKRLVGASNWFIRGPYLLESVLFTIFSVAVTIVIIYFAWGWLDQYLSIVFPNGFSLTNYYESHMLYLFGAQTAVVLFLTTISSSLAMRKQLKV